MTNEQNELGQPIGFAVPEWTPPPLPPREPMVGRFCHVEPLDAKRHGADLYAANRTDADGRMWTYLGYGPFSSLEEYVAWAERMSQSNDPLFHAIIDTATGKAVGIASYLRIDTTNGVIEVGHLAYSPLLQRTPAATEAMYLMMERAFTLGYRRYEWKCNALNEPSRTAAQRLGFSFEGIFRQAIISKGRNRDTAWFATIDKEWPSLRAAFEQWLAPENFTADGQQRTRLSELTGPILHHR